MDPLEVRYRLSAIRSRLGGRAAGAWRAEGGRLALVAFDPAPDLPADVAQGFEDATRSVELASAGLGIVRAAVTGRVAVSVARELAPEAGSGWWLRAFGAARSVAVPVVGEGGRVEVVISIALGVEPGEKDVEAIIRDLDWA